MTYSASFPDGNRLIVFINFLTNSQIFFFLFPNLKFKETHEGERQLLHNCRFTSCIGLSFWYSLRRKRLFFFNNKKEISNALHFRTCIGMLCSIDKPRDSREVKVRGKANWMMIDA